MKPLAIGLLVFLAVGCTTLKGAPATVNSPLDWAKCYVEFNTDYNRYYQERDLERVLEIMSNEGITFMESIAHTRNFMGQLRTAKEMCQKHLELREAVHQHYLTTGRW